MLDLDECVREKSMYLWTYRNAEHPFMAAASRQYRHEDFHDFSFTFNCVLDIDELTLDQLIEECERRFRQEQVTVNLFQGMSYVIPLRARN